MKALKAAGLPKDPFGYGNNTAALSIPFSLPSFNTLVFSLQQG
jgi:uncharacterized protein (DUF2141 family)